jgi:hypothetical protein
MAASDTMLTSLKAKVHLKMKLLFPEISNEK